MIPRITTLEHIDTVMTRLPAWRGPVRVRVLKACKKRIMVLQRAGKITNEQASSYRAKVLPKLKAAEFRLKQQEARRQAEDEQFYQESCEALAAENLSGENHAMYIAVYTGALIREQQKSPAV